MSVESKPETKKDLKKAVDYIASEYIRTQSFKDMKNLGDSEYCENLVILTSKVIAENLNDKEVEYLSQSIQDNVEVNDMTTDKVIYTKRKTLDKLDIKSKPNKERMCIGIAKFYVKIDHLFAAIMMTVNPKYTYTDASGVRQTTLLENKDKIPNMVRSDVVMSTLCGNRRKALVNNQNFNIDKNAKMVVNPNFCGMNYDATTGKDRKFVSEPGIPELQELYYDNYNYETGKFIGMTDKMRKDVYEKDVETFYKAFTGKKSIPVNSNGEKTVTTFSQIPLKDFHKSEGCVRNGDFRKPQTGSLKEKLFKEYAENAAKMLVTTQTNQNKLLDVLDELFAFRINPRTERKEIVINPDLTSVSLQEVVDKTRKLIVELYVGCEEDFIKGLNIFEGIVGKQILDTAQARIQTMEGDMENNIVEGENDDEDKDDGSVNEFSSRPSTPGNEIPIRKHPNSLSPVYSEDYRSPTSVSATSISPSSVSVSPLTASPSIHGGGVHVIEPQGEIIGGGVMNFYIF